MAELKGDAEVTAALGAAEIEGTFDLGYHTKNVDVIFARVFGGSVLGRTEWVGHGSGV